MMANNATGLVARVYPDDKGCFVRLKGLAPDVRPKNGFFFIELGHPNYQSLFTLALTAATEGKELTIRIDPEQGDISADEIATVGYMYIDW